MTSHLTHLPRRLLLGPLLALLLTPPLIWAARPAPSVVVDPGSATVGQYASLAIVNGNPAISYIDSTNQTVKYVRATDASGTAWGTPVTVDSRQGDFISLAVINGKPAVSFHAIETGELMYAQASDANGDTWTGAGAVDNGIDSDFGWFTSLAVVNGNPAISYFDNTNLDLRYVRATNADGTAWGDIISVDTEGNVGNHASLAVVNGNPAISYYDETNGNVQYVRALDTTGTTWGQPMAVESNGNVGEYASLEVIAGNPAISYYDRTNGDLKYVRAIEANGILWNPPVAVSMAGDVGEYASLTVVNGTPAIGYLDRTNNTLKYVRATDPTGTAWGAPVAVDVSGQPECCASLAVVNGNPAIAYYDDTHRDLSYVRASDVSGTTWGTPTTADADQGDVGEEASQAVVNGKPAISYYDATNVALRYVRALDATGTTWDRPTILRGTEVSGQQLTSLAEVNGNPAIGYYGDGIRYVRALDANGASWATSVGVEDIVMSAETRSPPSLAVVNGNPAMSYHDYVALSVKYVRATDVNGDAWGTPLEVGNGGMWNSMAVVNGNPAISYYDYSDDDVKYVQASDANGTTWGTPVQATGGLVFDTALAEVAGNPAISYISDTGLRYVRAQDANGTTWGTSVIVDNTGGVNPADISLKVVNGNPAISYYDSADGDLRYVRALDANGTTWGTPIVVESNGDVGGYASLVPLGKNAGISYYDAVNKDLKYAYVAGCTLVGDVNTNGTVNVADLQAIATHWLTTDPLYNLDGTGSVAVSDILRAAARFGQTC